jgi:Ca2+-binding EF-hand superfamily protein
MSSRYGRPVSVDGELPNLLKGFTKEVLRHQPDPDQFYAFGAEYFESLLAEERSRGTGLTQLSREELEELLTKMFHEADADRSGALSLAEFKDVLQMADLGLSSAEAKLVMCEADFNDDGEISYAEFIPLAIDLIQAMYARMEAEAKARAEEAAVAERAYELVHGLGREQVEAMIREVFQRCDVDGSGALSLAEFQKCCQDADLGLTKKEVKMLMLQCDVDQSGSIEYGEFVPVCFEILVEFAKNEVRASRTPSELEQFLVEVWALRDRAGTGTVHVTDLTRGLQEADLGLTRLQIHSVTAEAACDAAGNADYIALAPKAAEIIYKLLDPDAMYERHLACQQMHEQSTEMWHGRTSDEVAASLYRAFSAADPSSAGTVPMLGAMDALRSCDLQLSEKDMIALLGCADVDEGKGLLMYESICNDTAFYILQYLEETAALAF